MALTRQGLTGRDFVQTQANFYYPSANYPHVHVRVNDAQANPLVVAAISISIESGGARFGVGGPQNGVAPTLAWVRAQLPNNLVLADNIWTAYQYAMANR